MGEESENPTLKTIILGTITTYLLVAAFVAGYFIKNADLRTLAAPNYSINQYQYNFPYAKTLNKNEVLYGGNLISFNRPNIYITRIDYWTTYSMTPTFGTNNTFIMEVKPKNLSIGDIVSFQVGDYGVSHRIVRIVGDCYYTKGDAAFSEDGTCWHESDAVYRYLGVIWTR